jgi:hypothetical protein
VRAARAQAADEAEARTRWACDICCSLNQGCRTSSKPTCTMGVWRDAVAEGGGVGEGSWVGEGKGEDWLQAI